MSFDLGEDFEVDKSVAEIQKDSHDLDNSIGQSNDQVRSYPVKLHFMVEYFPFAATERVKTSRE